MPQNILQRLASSGNYFPLGPLMVDHLLVIFCASAHSQLPPDLEALLNELSGDVDLAATRITDGMVLLLIGFLSVDSVPPIQ